MAIKTALTDLFGLKYPLIQAPMAYASGGDLVREVARAGGLGMIGTGTRATIPWLEAEWQKLDGATAAGVGFMIWGLDKYEGQRALLDRTLSLNPKPAAVLISFGDPSAYIPIIHEAGVKVISQVQTVGDAMLAASAGADLLVVQGTEAGGHCGRIGTLPLLSAVLEADLGLPVAAAGGLGTGRDLAGVMAMGACGGMMGTRFLATPESLYGPAAKERIVAATESDTVYTRIFDIVQSTPWPEKYPGRALVNDFTKEWHGREATLAENLTAAKERYEAARSRGDYNTLVVYAGQVAGQIREIVPAGDLVRRIGHEAEVFLRA